MMDYRQMSWSGSDTKMRQYASEASTPGRKNTLQAK